MVIGVVILVATAGDDTPRPAVVAARGLYRVLAVITALTKRQAFFVISENDAIARVGERSVILDKRQRLVRLARQIGQQNPVDRNGEFSRASPSALQITSQATIRTRSRICMPDQAFSTSTWVSTF